MLFRSLRSCYQGALGLAEAEDLASVAFPALSTGAFGYPLEAAARASLDEVLAALPGLDSVRRIRFALFGEETLAAHEEALRALLAEEG